MDASSENINGWEKARILANVVASVLIPLVIVWVTSIYSSSQKEKDLNARYIELAIGILRDEPNPGSDQIRNWAIEIINLYSDVKISDSTRNQLLKNRIILAPKDVIEFQSEAGLAPDGIVGPATIYQLNQDVRRLIE